ncbi:hypothetical protein P167DRAFT_604803 [Morchella conica CCBAS932]|uniref:HECT-type E3 ubiquitin transferase n=1 Tax=Morchella conica CCBAS932 TaxID=1392247 RepID=A0A3N4KSM9_9PEZI|nr:hypothetical protein P167DRAFT_604803 [Morchella conica CCBAS932]
MAHKELEEEEGRAALRLHSFEYAVLPANAPEVIIANTIYVRAPDKIEPVVDAERRRGFQGLVKRYMNQLLYGCQRERCDTATCYTFRKTLSRSTNASRKLTVLSARIIACHLATQDDPFKALCPGKPVVPVMSLHAAAAEAKEAKSGTSRDSSFREEIHDDDEAEKENKDMATVSASPGGGGSGSGSREQKRSHGEGEAETVTDKGLKDPKSFPQQLFNTMSLKMVEWIGLPPITSALRFSSEGALPATTGGPPRLSDLNSTPGSGSAPLSPHEQPPRYKFHSSPMELIDTGRLHRDSEPVSQHKHQEILQQPPAQKRRASNPVQKALIDVVTPTHPGAAKAKHSLAGARGKASPAVPPPIGHHSHKQRLFLPQTPQVTPTRGEKHVQISSQIPASELVTPPQSLSRLDLEICTALVNMYSSDNAATKADVCNFAKQSLFYVFSTPEALLKSFTSTAESEAEEDYLDLATVDRSLRTLVANPEWEIMILRSMWMGLEAVYHPKVLKDRDAARLILLALHVLAAMLPVSTPEEWEATRKLRGSGRVSEAGAVSEIGFENEMAERLMRRVVRAVAYRVSHEGDHVADWIKGYFQRCGASQEERRQRVLSQELGEELAKLSNSGKGGWSLSVCTLEWCRAVLLKAWDGQETAKRGSVVASSLVLLDILHEDHKSYGLEPEYFYTPVLSDRYDAKDMPVEWFNATPDPKIVHFLEYPFIFPPHAIVTYFRAVNLYHMSKAFDKSMTMVRLTHQMSVGNTILNPSLEIQNLMRKMRVALNMYLLVEVNRETVLEDALNQIFRRELRELQRPLKVRFSNSGEEGVDHGGVQQEFFIISMREALRPDYGMFTTDERSRMSWFSVCPVEPIHKFELLGLLVGLAVYNGVTLPVTFPRILYKKLLGMEATSLDDIKDGWSSLASGLQELLDWGQGDVGDVFLRTYDFSYEAFGAVKNVNMLNAKETGLEFLEDKIARPPASSKQKKEKKEEKKFEADTVEGLLDWLPVPVEQERDPWLGGLNEVLDVLNRAESPERPESPESPGRQRGYEITLTEWPGEDPWEDVEEAERRQSLGVDAAAAAAAAGESERAGAGEAEVADEVEESSRTGVEMSFVELTAESVQEESRAKDEELAKAKAEAEASASKAEAEASAEAAAAAAADDTAGEKEGEMYLDGERSSDTSDARDMPEGSSRFTESWHEAEEEAEEAELVTNSNREQYVKDYISWLTDRSIRRQYQAFEKGFFAVLDPKALGLFTPASLQSLVEGNQEIDIEELEKTARYDDGYGPEHKTIRDFWSIVKGFNSVKKRQLLEFVTASDRVPVNGIGSIMFYIQRNGPDTDRVPTSLTCFGRLLLPEYSGRKKLKEKLKLALENGKGFGVP